MDKDNNQLLKNISDSSRLFMALSISITLALVTKYASLNGFSIFVALLIYTIFIVLSILKYKLKKKLRG